MSERHHRTRQEQRKLSRARRAAAGATLAIASVVGAGVAHEASDARHISPTEYSKEYGNDKEMARRHVIHDYLEKLADGEEVTVLQGVRFSLRVDADGQKRTLEVVNPIAMEGNVDGQEVTVGYLGIAHAHQGYPEGFVAVFVSPDAKIGAGGLVAGGTEQGTGLELNSNVYVEAHTPAEEGELPRGYSFIYSGSGDATIYVNEPKDTAGGLLNNTVGNAIADGTPAIPISGTSRDVPPSHIIGIPEGLASGSLGGL